MFIGANGVVVATCDVGEDKGPVVVGASVELSCVVVVGVSLGMGTVVLTGATVVVVASDPEIVTSPLIATVVVVTGTHATIPTVT